MNEKPKPPTIVTAVCSTVMGLFALAGCLFAMKSGGPDFLVLGSIVANVGLRGLEETRGKVSVSDTNFHNSKQETSHGSNTVQLP